MSTKQAILPPHLPNFDAQLIEAVNARDAHGNPLHASRKGVSSEYYELPCASDYVMRISRRALRSHPISELLEEYSSLTPPHHLIVGANIGQTLLSSQDHVISILQRVAGIPLTEHINKTADALGLKKATTPEQRTQIHMNALIDTMRDIIGMTTVDADGNPGIEHNPFIPLFEQAYEIAHLGYDPNFYPDAIFIDLAGKKLGLVNQLSNHTSRYHMLNEPVDIAALLETQQKRVLSTFRMDYPKAKDCADYQYSFWQFDKLLTAARAKVIENHHARERDIEHNRTGQPDYEAPPPLLAFADVKDTRAVVVKSPSHVVMQRLRELQESPIQTRNYY